jgi:hypothetical protein
MAAAFEGKAMSLVVGKAASKLYWGDGGKAAADRNGHRRP